jgi:heparanase 1
MPLKRILAVVKKLKFQVVIRQSLYHGCYALIGEDGQPNPDYWVSHLYKQLVSNYVLNVTGFQFPPSVRVYAHCAKQKSGFGYL